MRFYDHQGESHGSPHPGIGLYHSLAEAEGIVRDLVEQGLPVHTLPWPLPMQPSQRLSTSASRLGARWRASKASGAGSSTSGSPTEVHTYTEAVRQGDTLVVVQASAEQAERGLDILHGPRPADRQTGRPHWQYLGHVGVISRGDPTQHTAPEMVDTPGLARAEADFRQHQEATAPEAA